MRRPAPIRRCVSTIGSLEPAAFRTLCVLTLFLCLGMVAPGCERAGSHIIFIPLDAYDPYPYLNAEGAASDTAESTLWRARQVVLESELVARYEARAAEYRAFLASSPAADIERKPRPARTVNLARPVNINRADAAELQLLPRVGPAMSARIIGGRPYGSTGDLMRIRGIGPRTMEQLAPLIVVGGE